MIDSTVLLAPINWLLDPQSRTFYLYWLSSLFIVVIWASFSWNKRKAYLSQFTQKDYWWNRSTRQDYSVIMLNALLFSLLGLSWVILTINIANQSFEFLEAFLIPRIFADSSAVLLFISFSLVFILTEDLSRYALHRLLHWKFFWRIHQLHHSATVLTPISFLRAHPIEKLLYQLRSALVYGSLTGCFFFLVGKHPEAWLIFGIAGGSLIFNILGANLRHSMVPISYGRLEKIFISPLQHQLHHSPQYSRKNYGAIFAFWDVIFSSWKAGDKPAPLPRKEKSLIEQLLLKSLD
jgi:sterol desaturase/sphingolipid hydroxylase (fatty acid hydroxylase superfamily)